MFVYFYNIHVIYYVFYPFHFYIFGGMWRTLSGVPTISPRDRFNTGSPQTEAIFYAVR